MSEKKGFFGGLFGRKKKEGEETEAPVQPDDDSPSPATTGEEASAEPGSEGAAMFEGSDWAPAPQAGETEDAAARRDDPPDAPLEGEDRALEPDRPPEGPAPSDVVARNGDALDNRAFAAELDENTEPEAAEKRGFFARLKDGLSKTSAKLADGVSSIFTRKKLDDETLEELEDLLITADLGVAAAARVVAALAKDKFDKEVSDEEVKTVLAEEVARTLEPLEAPIAIDPANRPHVILVAGVNGAGKTTTIGKLAKKFREDGKSVMLAAGDTFRAAAIEQLQVWGERTGAPVIAREVGADAAGLAYDAVEAARAQNIDVLMIDTAGRLQNRRELMDELAKVVRVVRKLDETAPHPSLLVLDATVGQNALSQADVFRDVA
ncbi:MAG: signal recognition particle receptor subunit alpha, partial [Pseudomonadota bacterium]